MSTAAGATGGVLHLLGDFSERACGHPRLQSVFRAHKTRSSVIDEVSFFGLHINFIVVQEVFLISSHFWLGKDKVTKKPAYSPRPTLR